MTKKNLIKFIFLLSVFMLPEGVHASHTSLKAWGGMAAVLGIIGCVIYKGAKDGHSSWFDYDNCFRSLD